VFFRTSPAAAAAMTALAGIVGSDNFTTRFMSPALPNVTLSYGSFSNVTDTIATSRVMAGLHYRHSIAPSLALGKAVANKVLEAFMEKPVQRRLRA
jgi:hypothetical protein